MCDTNSSVDKSLTPKNAANKSYIYISDVPDLLKCLNELYNEAAKSGYKLGLAKKGENRLGLYKCINNAKSTD
jgi:hypothetical protein